MKITIIGTGYVGLVVGACFSDLGHDVLCVDIDEKKIEKLNKGIPTIYEPGLGDLLSRNLKQKRIAFTSNIQQGVQYGDIIFIAVGTPTGQDGKINLSYIKQAASDIGKYMDNYKVIVNKSTVPVGTGDLVRDVVKQNQKEQIDFDVVSNPEFLREGNAIQDFTVPDRIVIGTNSEKAKEIMNKIYLSIARTGKPIMFTSLRSAEMIKYASNAMLATRISFMNELSRLCENAGADIKEVAKGTGLDSRIGPRFLQAGVGYGGSCFSKDIKALIETGENHSCDMKILSAVEHVNHEQKKSILPKVKKLVSELKDKKIAVWGLAFKPKTDDMRDAPSIIVINHLKEEGANVVAFDPEAKETAKREIPNLQLASDPYSALEGADCLIILTEWNEFRSLDKKKMKNLMRAPNVVDGRNIYNPSEMKALGFNYIGVGRS